MKCTYTVHTYELFGNDDEGYEVNDVFKTNDTITLDSGDNLTEVLNAIRAKFPWLITEEMTDIEIEGEDMHTLYFSLIWGHGKPLFELRCIDEV